MFHWLGAPAPYLIGSVFGVWLLGAILPPLHPHLGVARWFHIPVVLGLGVLIGTSFTPELIAKLPQWIDTVLAMIFATALATTVGLFYLVRLRGWDPKLATLCAIPGGQAEIIVIARDLVEKDYVVALCHLARVAMVFFITPLFLALVGGEGAVEASYVTQQQIPSLWDLTPVQLVQFLGLALGGYVLARLVRMPMSHLLGPLALSVVAHSAGWIALPRTAEFVILAQMTIGGAVGARLAKVPFREVASYIPDAIVNALLLIGTYILLACALAFLLGETLLSVVLAFIPGGLYEVTLLALIFGYDIAFVAFHHTVRVVLIFFALPFFAKRLKHD